MAKLLSVRARALAITLVFMGLTTYEEGVGSAMNYVEVVGLAVLYATGLYLNPYWLGRLVPRSVYRVNFWRWRLVLEPEPQTPTGTVTSSARPE